MALKVELSRN